MVFACALDRLIGQHSARITSLEVHRLWFAAYLLATKFYCDEYYSNTYYSKVAGVAAEELGELECELLELLQYRLLISPSLFDLYKEKVEKYMKTFLENM
eukprot:TRINITY_DN657_c0_g3_i4.p3 TRINITY_DN657_c0_g3~~TRINITY_DN657_c0_g3_i4.p3  ORF type:complete len:100 (-),score=30.34 TRINITY_DN657_c0_g3_i4:153-452(-)